VALKKSEKRLLYVLVVVVAVFLIDRFVLSAGEEEPSDVTQVKAQTPKTSNIGVSPTSIVSGNNVITAAVQKAKQFDTWGRDPFTIVKPKTRVAVSPVRKQKKTKQLPTLKGIFWKRGKAFVLLDDMVLTEGEEMSGLKIEKIEGMEVLCSQDNQSFTLYWRESP